MGTSRAQAFQDIHPEFVALWKDGLHPLELAAALGLSLSAIHAHALRAYQDGVTPPDVPYVVIRAKSLPKAVRGRFPAFSGERLLRVEGDGEGLLILPTPVVQRTSVAESA